FWPDEDPLGKRIAPGDSPPGKWATIVGIVGDVRNEGLNSEPYPQMYRPYMQSPSRNMTLVARAASGPMSLVPAIRGRIWNLDKAEPLYNIRTMEQVLSDSVAQPRFNMLLIAIFAGVALILASVGIYGVISYSVSQRTHEIGIRLALGAQSTDILRMVVGQGLKLALIGI